MRLSIDRLSKRYRSGAQALSAYVNRLQQGETEEEVLMDFLSSEEYFRSGWVTRA